MKVCETLIVLFAALCVFGTPVFAQVPVNFHHLSVNNGLNDVGIGDLCEDQEGFMWFATFGAINRFDGIRVDRFTHIAADSTSPPASIAYAITSDANGRLWIGYADGLVEYDFINSAFRSVPSMKGHSVFRLVSGTDGNVYIPSRSGIRCFSPTVDSVIQAGDPADSTTYLLLNKTRPGAVICQGNYLYAGYHQKLLKYNMTTGSGQVIAIPGMKGSVDVLGIDLDGMYWVASDSYSELLYVDTLGKVVERLDSLLNSHPPNLLSIAENILADPMGRIWISTNQKGLIDFDKRTHTAQWHQHDDRLGYSISSNLLRGMMLDSRGLIWTTSVSGVDYFDPEGNLFGVIYPYPHAEDLKYARGIMEDHLGNYWFTTSDGIVRYAPSTHQYTSWRNTPEHPHVIYHNSSRGIMEDADGLIWFVTASGVNRLDPMTGKIDFLDAEDGLPRGFYLSVTKDREGNLWFCTRDYDGFYKYSPVEKKITGISSHPRMKDFVGLGGRYVFEDSKGRYWLGCNGNGLAMYDPRTDETRHWYNANALPDTTVIGNLIIDIDEDRNGVIWVSTFSGLSGIDLEHQHFYAFNEQNGLRSNVAGPLSIDSLNRIWVGMSNGLVMIDSARQTFTYFGEEDGIPTTIFNEYAALNGRDGTIIMPTTYGYIQFDPLRYHSKQSILDSYITAFHLFDQEYPISSLPDGTAFVTLKPLQNFFTFTLGSLNFTKASQTWYAYQLVGFDRDWRYTQDAKAVYTNVPGGTYTFRYKASPDALQWDGPEHLVRMRIENLFYKTVWFWALVIGFIMAILYWIYTNRTRAQRAVHMLQSKAQLLEKEKAVVQYESLKQQLNPHFLFNSLTSLSSLIHMDQDIASDFLESLSKTYRYILKSSEHETVSLGEELNFAKTYVKLQMTRFAEGLEVDFLVEEADYHKKIVPVTIQNLVENAIKHNIIDIDTPLRIRIEVVDNYLLVSNNLQRKNFVETSNKQGIANLKALYKYLSDRKLEIIETVDTFTVKIPLL